MDLLRLTLAISFVIILALLWTGLFVVAVPKAAPFSQGGGVAFSCSLDCERKEIRMSGVSLRRPLALLAVILILRGS